jgi:hypothetical protein
MRLKEADPFYEKSEKTLSYKYLVFPSKFQSDSYMT